MLANPEVLIRGRRYPGTSRAEEILDHPALLALAEQACQTEIADQDWVCGTPHVLNAVARLRAARQALPGGGGS